MRWPRLTALVTVKELRATMRDPHVLAYLLFPLLLYPALILGIISVLSYRDGWRESESWNIDVSGPPEIVEILAEGNTIMDGGLDALRRGDLDAVITAEESGDTVELTVHYVSIVPRSWAAHEQINERMDDVREARLSVELERHGIDPDLVEPVSVERKARKGPGQLTRWLAALLLSMVVPVSMLIAGIYPAVELIVAERERQTMETTLVAPVPRTALLAGKVLAAVFMMLAAGFGNAIAVALTANQMVFLLTQKLSSLWIPPLSSLVVLPGLVGTCILFAGLNLVAVLPARTFKEAEYTANIVMSALMLAMLSGMFGLLTGTADDRWMWLPAINSTLALYYALLGEFHLGWAIVPAVVNTSCGFLLVWICAKVLDREEVLFGTWLPKWISWVRKAMPE